MPETSTAAVTFPAPPEQVWAAIPGGKWHLRWLVLEPDRYRCGRAIPPDVPRSETLELAFPRLSRAHAAQQLCRICAAMAGWDTATGEPWPPLKVPSDG